MAIDNRLTATQAKQELRLRLLDAVSPKHVLEVFCGVDGVMFDGAWRHADRYLGIDRRFDVRKESRPRIVGNAHEVMDSLDLSPWSIFDVDAYGDPWSMLRRISERKRWQNGERYGLAITDGNQAKLKFGTMPLSMACLLGLDATAFTYRDTDQIVALHRRCIARWAKLSGLTIEQAWQHVSLAGSEGSLCMIYSGVVLRA